MPQGSLLHAAFAEPTYAVTLPNGAKLVITVNPNDGSGAMKVGKDVAFFTAVEMELLAYIFGTAATNCRKCAEGLSADSQIHPFNSELVRERWPQLSIIP